MSSAQAGALDAAVHTNPRAARKAAAAIDYYAAEARACRDAVDRLTVKRDKLRAQATQAGEALKDAKLDLASAEERLADATREGGQG